MSRTPSPRPAEPSRLLRLPEELLIAILDSFERYGVYQELKVLERVCKRLQRLVQVRFALCAPSRSRDRSSPPRRPPTRRTRTLTAPCSGRGPYRSSKATQSRSTRSLT